MLYRILDFREHTVVDNAEAEWKTSENRWELNIQLVNSQIAIYP
jgi:hypothetical protein